MEAIVATGLGALTLAGFLYWMRGTTTSMRRTRALEGRDEIAVAVRSLLKCEFTKPLLPTPCAAGTFIDLYKKAGVKFVEVPTTTTFTNLGSWNIRASCTATPGLFNIEISEITGANCKPGMTAPCWEALFNIPRGCP